MKKKIFEKLITAGKKTYLKINSPPSWILIFLNSDFRFGICGSNYPYGSYNFLERFKLFRKIKLMDPYMDPWALGQKFHGSIYGPMGGKGLTLEDQ